MSHESRKQCCAVPAPAQVSRFEDAGISTGLSAALVHSIAQPLYKIKEVFLSVETSAYTDDYQNHPSDLLLHDPCVRYLAIYSRTDIS